MAVGIQTPRFSATQSEPDQQDNESCDSLVLTVSDGSVHVKSEPCSENEGSGPERNDNDLFGLGVEATGDTPDFEEAFDSLLPGSPKSRPGFFQSRTDKPSALPQQSDKGLSVPQSRRWATLDQGGH